MAVIGFASCFFVGIRECLFLAFYFAINLYMRHYKIFLYK